MLLPSDIAVLVVAAGRGTRVGGIPKQYQSVGGVPVLRRALDVFLGQPVGLVMAVIHSEDSTAYASIAPRDDRLMTPATGGATRQESVLSGLQNMQNLALATPRYVLIHDAARPWTSTSLVRRVVDALSDADAVLPALAVTDSLRKVDAEGQMTGSVERDGLVTAQTPQGFRFDRILDAHRRAADGGLTFTDDAALAAWAGMSVRVVAGEHGNVKLTTPEDFAVAERRLLAERALALGDIRVGTGYDVHAFTNGTSVMLGGVAIPHDRGLAGHSDADVALHALTDAILGVLGEGDIGSHFPPSDPKWKGASSDRFLAFAAERVAARGGAIAHLDLAIIAEAPKIGPHREAMRVRIAAICGVSIDRVGVKATTNEGMGFIGRGEGIAAIATATIRLPFGAAP
jgi:2-C-methyl-D-erythritol 4-phosphate cytidylyltransferase/2-C-methyl-D-erythritol 2,4-cyclodiphosphate synthase